MKKPIKESEQEEFTENQQELEIEEYLNDTYNLTKVLNKQKEKRRISRNTKHRINILKYIGKHGLNKEETVI